VKIAIGIRIGIGIGKGIEIGIGGNKEHSNLGFQINICFECTHKQFHVLDLDSTFWSVGCEFLNLSIWG
jgi:hypothetical protein